MSAAGGRAERPAVFQVLLVEDNPVYSHWLKRTLGRVESLRLTHVERLADARAALAAASFDLILLDLSLPDCQGFETFASVHGAAPDVPVVVLTATDDDELASRAVEAGAQDFLIKEEVKGNLLVRSIRAARERHRLRREIEQQAAELRLGHVRLEREVAERRRAEEELRETQAQLIQSAKLQSVGQLAAGVAHEVKNPLMIILAGARFLTRALHDADDDVRMVLDDISEATTRADVIVRGLVDFSAPTQLELLPVDLHEVVERSLGFVHHELVRCHVAVELDPADGPLLVQGDANKLQQVFVNVFINASHAMREGGGVLTVRSRRRSWRAADARMAAQSGLVPGDAVVVVEVEDTGHGIPEHLLGSVLDPFFTTKPTGEGTGLGLSIIRKLMELHGGVLAIANRGDVPGARVTLALPAAPVRRPSGDRTPPLISPGSER